MVITARVKSQYFQQDQKLNRLAPDQDRSVPTKRAGIPWTIEEHDLFLEGLERFPPGPWKAIAIYIETRTTRQTMTHAQKYREKITRRQKAKEAASPTNKGEDVLRVVTTRAGPLKALPTQKNDIDRAARHHNGTQQPVEIELDGSVITLLETPERFDMASALETLDSTTYLCCPTKLKATYS